MRALFGHFPLVQHHNLVRVAHRAEPVRHHHYGLSPVELVQVFHYLLLVVGIQGVGRLVKEEEFGILVNGPCYQQPLFLPLAEPIPLHADSGVVAQRERVDEFPDVRHAHGMPQPFDVRLFGAYGNVVRDGIGEDESVLHHRPALSPPQVRVYHSQRRLSQPDAPLAGRVESQHQLDQRGLSAATGTHDGGHLVPGDAQAHVVQHVIPVRAVIAEGHVAERDVPLFGQGGELGGDVLLLVLLPVYLIEPFEAYLRILQLLCEPDERRDRAVELPDDVGQRHHHAQGHLSVHHRLGSDEGDDDVRGPVEEDGARLLHLSQCQPPDADFEKFHLNPFPLPSFLLLAVVQLYLLHAVHQLHHRALVGALLGKPLVVQFRPFLHEEPDVGDVECAPSHEDKENHAAVHQQHDAEYQDVEGGERHAEAASGQVVLYAREVVDALQDVARQLGAAPAHSENFKDEAHIIYVNSKKQEDTELGRLMHDLHCKNAEDMHSKILADRVYELKETQKGVEFMCREMEQIYSEGIESGELKKAKASALSMAADGMKVDKIAHYLNVSAQMVQKWIDESMSVAH